MQTQDKAKGMQTKHSERVEWFIQKKILHSLPKEMQWRQIQCVEVRGNQVIKIKHSHCESFLGERQVTTRFKHDAKCTNRTRDLNQ